MFGQSKLIEIIGNQSISIGFWFLDLGFGLVELANEAIETEKLRKKREESYRHRENRIIDDQAGVWRPAAKANSASVSV